MSGKEGSIFEMLAKYRHRGIRVEKLLSLTVT
jgi:hypothetical protein